MYQNLLENITAVEISTAIVDEIVDEVFIPWEAYQGIYYLSRSYLAQLAIAPALHNRYLQLRRQLELGYCLLLINPSSQLYSRALVPKIEGDLSILGQPDGDWETIPTRLPEPIPQHRQKTFAIDRLWQSPKFIDLLCQLNRRKIELERRNLALTNSPPENNITDTAYAQTSLQLNGKIVNRYCQTLLKRSDRQLLLQVHQQSTTAGERQWRGLIEFVLALVAS